MYALKYLITRDTSALVKTNIMEIKGNRHPYSMVTVTSLKVTSQIFVQKGKNKL